MTDDIHERQPLPVRCGDSLFEFVCSLSMSVRQFESQLQQLDDTIRRSSDGVVAIRAAQDALNCLVPVDSAAVFVCFRNQSESLRFQLLAASSSSTEEMLAAISRADESPDEILIQALAANAVHSLRHPGKAETAAEQIRHVITCRRPVTDAISTVIAFAVAEEPADRRLVQDAVHAIADCLFGLVTKRLILNLEQQQNCRAIVDPIVHDLLSTQDATDCARRFVEHASSLLPETRISVCSRLEDACRVMAISGTSQPDTSAAAVRLIEQIAWELNLAERTGRWIATADATVLPTLITRCASAGIVQLRCDAIQMDTRSVSQTVLVERFNPQWDDRAETLLRTLVSGYQSAVQRRKFPSTRAVPQGFLKSPARKIGAVLLGCLLALLIIPARFEIEVQGQLFPQERRRIFAPDDGLIEEVIIESDQRVTVGASLLKIRNPERELELNRVLGEIETTASRLQAIRTMRSGTGGLSAIELAELGSEEQQMEQKLKALREEQGLVEKQIASLTLTAPIEGIVYQRRLQEQLTKRPVQRGQMLLEIGSDSGGWQLELLVPDTVAGYVRQAAVNQPPRVEYLRAGQLQGSASAAVSSIALASHLEDGQLGCLAFADVTTTSAADFRPGESVTARIDCGRRSLGFVWFRELIEFCQKKMFAWL